MPDGDRLPARRRGPATFKQRDLTAAIKAAKAAGADNVVIEIDPSGRMRVIVGPNAVAAEGRNPWDED